MSDVAEKVALKCEDNLFCGVNMPKDMEHMTDLEKKHLPVITAPSKVRKNKFFELTVEVGKLMEHPNEPGHHLEFIELYADQTYLARLDLTARMTMPIMKLNVALDHIHGQLRAFVHCNLHGTWQGRTDIKVE